MQRVTEASTELESQNKTPKFGLRCYQRISLKLNRKHGFMGGDFEINNQHIFSPINKVTNKLASEAHGHLQRKLVKQTVL